MNPSQTIRPARLIKPAGYLVTAVCLVLVGLKIYQGRTALAADLDWSQTLGLVLTGSGVFAANCFWLALAWAAAINSLGRPKVDLKSALAVYGRSWLAKYLPGNVFHFAGRQILGRSLGLSHGRLAAGLVLEAGGQTSLAGLLVLWGMAAHGLGSAGLSLPLLAVLVLAAPLAWLGLNRLALHPKVAPKLDLEPGVSLGFGSGMWPVPLFYAIYYLTTGGTAWLLLGVLGGQAPAASLGYVVSLFSLSWILGYITPGAPAGMGVREAVLVYGLAPLCGQEAALNAALHLRLMTLGGDLLFSLICRFLPMTTGPKNSGTAPGQ